MMKRGLSLETMMIILAKRKCLTCWRVSKGKKNADKTLKMIEFLLVSLTLDLLLILLNFVMTTKLLETTLKQHFGTEFDNKGIYLDSVVCNNMKNRIFGMKYKVSFHCLVHGQVVEDFYQIKDFKGMEIDIQFNPNLSYIKERNYAERKVKDLSSSLQQLTIINKEKGLTFTIFSDSICSLGC